ncbi:glycosyl hydrolase [Sphingomonas sp. So64.6b]|uniref:GH25 family lysozyme n=1 Tax=Sphingomonas sp. So64.6b TaxID=2997354 RepID=UPI0015FED05D|nr:GH25 family lysozyme [Sphingomonas sp. So64.6b]QNA83469.1 glycosyl hydrolase [Sphingomonas sp. So64.6b]
MVSLRLLGRRIGRTGAIVIAIALTGVVVWTLALSWRPSDTDYVFQGVDVSAAQGKIQWPTVMASGADFAYLRATMGATGRDDRFAANWGDTHASGIRRGAIHVWSFCQLAADQANNFNTTVPYADDALPAAIYLEFAEDCAARPARDVVVSEVKRFITMVESHTRKPVLLKIAQPVEAAYQLSASVPRPIWSMQNFFPPDYAARPWRMWQASDMRRIDGVEGPVHWNVVAP